MGTKELYVWAQEILYEILHLLLDKMKKYRSMFLEGKDQNIKIKYVSALMMHLNLWMRVFTLSTKLTYYGLRDASQSAFTFSKLTIETLEQGVKHVQS